MKKELFAITLLTLAHPVHAALRPPYAPTEIIDWREAFKGMIVDEFLRCNATRLNAHAYANTIKNNPHLAPKMPFTGIQSYPATKRLSLPVPPVPNPCVVVLTTM